jgi:ATP-dependent exoDNAse (exonuclease V) beta subunit
MFEPQDNTERQRIAGSIEETLFVEAGAGTGKTTSLVDRILELVGSGKTTLDRVAAITFTEAAAAELRDRIRAELEAAADDPTLSDERRNLSRQGVEHLDSAAIQTLHSFAAAILQERPLEAGLPPSFDTMDAIESELAFDEAWAQWIDAALDDPALRPHFLMTLSLGLKIDHLRSIALKFHENYDLLADVTFDDHSDASSGASSAVRNLQATAPEMERLCQFSQLGSEDILYTHTQARLASIRQFATLEAHSPAAVRLLSRLLPLRQGKGRQSDWGSDPSTGENSCRTLKALLQELDSEVTDAIAQARTAALMPLLDAIRSFALDYADKRKAQGRAGFHDLLVWTRNMLRDNLDARDHFRRRFSYLLIDEAQDTDFIQAEIAMFLAEHVPPNTPDAARPNDWADITPQEGKLFVVGDPKQSIYRFRRADVRQMRRLQERMRGKTLQLVQNFRSQRPVIEWVNTLFAKWMAQDSGEQAEYTPIKHRWTANTGHPAAPRVWALGGETAGKIGDVRREEAADITRLLHQIVGERWQILDRDATELAGTECYKGTKYSDICILMPTRTALRTLELALDEANVPYRLEGASLFFNTQEVRDLLNCLRAIDDPSDEIAIVAALRSPAFACTDVEILQFHHAHHTFNYLHTAFPPTQGLAGMGMGAKTASPLMGECWDGDDENRVAASLSALRKYHDARMWTATAALIDCFIRGRLLMESAISQPRTREQWRRYRFLVEQARAFAAAGGNSLRAFLEWVQRQAAEGARITETPVPESDEEAVRIMTVHAAKGLEFPVVILIGLNSRRRSRVDEVIFDSSNVEVGIGSQSSRFRTAGYEAKHEQEEVRENEEHVRLLYVATTRARDHLVLSMHRPDNRSSDLDSTRIAELLEDYDDLWEQVELQPQYQYQLQAMAPDALQAVQPHPADTAARTIEARDEWQKKRREVLAAQGRPASVAATGLAGTSKDEADADIEMADIQPSRRGRGGAPLGRAVHAVLQTIDLNTGDGIENTARAQATAEGIPQLQSEVAALAWAAVNSDIVRRAVASGRYWREAYIAAPIGRGVLEGFIDLLFEEDGELVVVDYKTDAIDANATEYIANSRYREQAGSYALITERVTKKRVKDVVFLFLSPKHEESMQDLDVLKESAKSAAENYLQRRQV